MEYRQQYKLLISCKHFLIHLVAQTHRYNDFKRDYEIQMQFRCQCHVTSPFLLLNYWTSLPLQQKFDILIGTWYTSKEQHLIFHVMCFRKPPYKSDCFNPKLNGNNRLRDSLFEKYWNCPYRVTPSNSFCSCVKYYNLSTWILLTIYWKIMKW